MLHQLKNRSLQTIILVAIYIVFAPSLSIQTHQIFYTISVFIKDVLIWLMPFTIGVFIASTIDSFEKKAPLFIFILILFEIFSNFCSIFYGYGIGTLASSQLPDFVAIAKHDGFTSLWRIPMPKPAWWGADKGSMVGVIVGCISAFKGSQYVKSILFGARHLMEMILTKGFARLIPLFVLGFVAQMYVTGILTHMVFYYGILLIYLLGGLLIYIFFIFSVGNLFNLSSTFREIKNLISAGFISFTSGCSLSTMPWTIEGTAKNLKNPPLAKAIIPATTNIQQIGDCIANSFLCFLIYKNYNNCNPDIITWFSFTLVFVALRFTTVAMIGGAVFLMLPIYQHYLNFNEEMLATILAFNVILDPIITSSNVMANGGLAKIFEKIWMFVSIKEIYFPNKLRILMNFFNKD